MHNWYIYISGQMVLESLSGTLANSTRLQASPVPHSSGSVGDNDPTPHRQAWTLPFLETGYNGSKSSW